MVDIECNWLNVSVFPRNPDSLFDQNAIDQFLMSLELLESARSEAIPPAWKSYQQNRDENSPNGKFVLFLQPAPIMMGDYSKYLELVKSKSFHLFSQRDYSKGGRLIGEELLEFHTKDDPPSGRVDVWIDRPIPNGEIFESIYSDTLAINTSAMYVWSSNEPYSLAVLPAVYEVDILLVNRGKYENKALADRDRFARDDLEQYEVYLNTFERKAKP